MSKPAARLTDMHVCPMVSGLIPHVGGPVLAPGDPRTLIGGLPAARVGDFAFCAGGPDLIAMGSFTVLIGGKPAARMGDLTAHGGSIVGGFPSVLIGDAGGGVGSPQGFTMGAARASGAAFTQTSCGRAAVLETEKDSPLLVAAAESDAKTHFIEIELLDEDGNPVPFVRFRVTPPNDAPREGFLDAEGFAAVRGIEAGMCKISFPDLDGRSWEPLKGGKGSSRRIDPRDLPSIQPATVRLRRVGTPGIQGDTVVLRRTGGGVVPPLPGGARPSIRGDTVALRRAGAPFIVARSVSIRPLAGPTIRPDSVLMAPLPGPSIRPDSVRLEPVTGPAIVPESVRMGPLAGPAIVPASVRITPR